MEQQLNHCPFCGSSAHVMDCRAGGFSVECKECNAEIGNDYESDVGKGLYETTEEATAAWNKRAMPEVPQVEMKAEAMTPDAMYLWKLPHGEVKPVWLNKEKDGIDEYDDGWYFDDGLVGKLYGPVTIGV